MKKFLNTFYLKYIRPADPGFLIVKYATKAAFSCLISFLFALLFRLEGGFFFWWMAGAVSTVFFRTGSTLKRRKCYTLFLLLTVAVTVPVAALIGNHLVISLGFIFLLSFGCFFLGSKGSSAAIIANGTLIVSLISLFSPTGFDQGILRSIALLFGGMIAFATNFYLWPLDPEKILFSSAKLAMEDMGFFLEGVCLRVKNSNVSEAQLSFLHKETMNSVRRYRTFMESFNIDPLKSTSLSDGSGIFYYALIRLFESVVGLSNHIHFADNRPEFRAIRDQFFEAASEISHAFDEFSKLEQKQCFAPPDFDQKNQQITEIRNALLNMGAYKREDAVQSKFLEAWGAVYGLKNVLIEFQELTNLAEKKFGLRRENSKMKADMERKGERK